MMNCLIFMAARPWPKRSLRWRWRVCRRWPKLWKACVFGKAVQFGTRSQWSHVALVYNGVVFERVDNGNVFTPHLAYRSARESLFISCPALGPIDWTRHESRGRPSRLASVLRWATFGMTPAYDCVGAVVAVLREGGVQVPAGVTSPNRLLHFLRECERPTKTAIAPGSPVGLPASGARLP